MSTPFHAKYFAYDIARHGYSGSIHQLAHSLFDASVDLNPHQIEAALFAVQSPLSKGVILADEVGLGKTIEAGLLLCQYWAERKRKLLVICPASIRKQWSAELTEKFHLPNTVLDARQFSNTLETAQVNPFDADMVYIVSIHFAGRYPARFRTIFWDLVVIDEAHKLRNVFKKQNKFAQNIKWALEERKKILLTATPLQNSLMELYGLASMIDEQLLGDPEAFRKQFVNKPDSLDQLQSRLSHFCRRTLRKHVTEYIRFTNRRSMMLPYQTTEIEQQFYNQISDFIRREDIYSIPHAQRHLLLQIMQKILASSRYAILSTLGILKERLEKIKEGNTSQDSLLDLFIYDDAVPEDLLENDESDPVENMDTSAIDPVLLEQEIKDIKNLIDLGKSIAEDTKADILLHALSIGFQELYKMNAQKKAVIFTESRRTQEYLAKILIQNHFDNIVLFNGSNNDARSSSIYQEWKKINEKDGRASGSRAIDIRMALVEYFRDKADIMIATEAAAEGINLQFCSLVINYDLPWNPQRIEQRIGRCHRYGQKHDVVVVNFINERNRADCRVFELLDKKLNMFNGVFGASDEILGQLESGIDFEKRIYNIYRECRSEHEIERAFSELQDEMKHVIDDKMQKTRILLLEHFDQDVHTRLRVSLDETRQHLDRIGKRFWQLSTYVLAETAKFDENNLRFDLLKSPLSTVKPGRYSMISKERTNLHSDFLYRLAHPLGEFVLAAGKNAETRIAHVFFDITNYPGKITPVEKLKGQSGWMKLGLLHIQSFEVEEVLILAGLTDSGKILDSELCDQFFFCRGAVSKSVDVPESTNQRLIKIFQAHIELSIRLSRDVNQKYFNEECDKIDHWTEDKILTIEKELYDLKKMIIEKSRQVKLTGDLVLQHKLQMELKKLEQEKREKRMQLFAVEDEVMNKRGELIEALSKQMDEKHFLKDLFILRWTVI